MGGKSKKKSVVGYKYFTTLHFALCHGQVDAIRSVWWADKVAWSGSVTPGPEGNAVWSFSNEGMFGGETSEGGASGTLEAGFGSFAQTMTGVLPDGTYGPAIGVWPHPSIALNYRGLCVLFMQDNYIGNNAYLKDLSVEVERYWKGWQPGLARIGDAMNPAHIIYECLTNDDWGLGYSADTIDSVAFSTAAQQLYNEGFGLGFLWDTDQDIFSFIDQIRTCIEASFYLHRRTGKWTIKLIRAGGSSLMTLDPSNSMMESFSRKVMGETSNELSVKWTNPQTEEYETVTVQDPANIEAQGRVVQTEKEYIGVRTQGLAITIAQRDLQTLSAQLAAAEVVVNRKGWDLMPGDIVTLNWPPLGLSGIQMRVMEATQAEPGSDDIRLQLGEDVFGRSSGSYAGVQPPEWEDPSQPPTWFTKTRPWEIPFFYAVQDAGSVDFIPTLSAYGTDLASGGNTGAKQVRLYSYVGTETGLAWQLQNIGEITPTSSLLNDLPASLTADFLVNPFDSFRLKNIQQDSFILIADGTHEEISLLTGSTADGGFTISRGLMDTHPRAWPAGTNVWFIGLSLFVDDITQRSVGEVAQYRAGMQTSQGYLDVNTLPVDTITLKGRWELPYSVANVLLNGQLWPASATADGSSRITVSWATRNRLLQDAVQQVPWNAASIAPEVGTTFEVALLKNGSVVKNVTGLTGTSVSLDTSGLTAGQYTLRVRAVRDGRVNYNDFEHVFTLVPSTQLTGYGNGYGLSYGL